MKKYIKIMRLDHWIKQFFIMPGIVLAFLYIEPEVSFNLIIRILRAFMGTCFIASSNYVINEWLDAEFDKYHPVKKHRSIVESNADKRVVYALYFLLAIIGFSIGCINEKILFTLIWLWVMGILYNVKPFRTKDIAFMDVLTESINNAIRLLIGWFVLIDTYFPPVSIVLGYWFGGAFLMATKRFSEYRMINDPHLAGLYRKSFKKYTTKSLIISAFFYAMCSVFFTGVFLIKYRIELVLFMPFYIGYFCYYLDISFKEDSAAQRPEKLFKERGLMTFTLILCSFFIFLMLVRIPLISGLVNCELIQIP